MQQRTNYALWYEGLRKNLVTHPFLMRSILWFNRLLPYLMASLYGALLIYRYQGDQRPQSWGPFLGIPALAFVLVSLFRSWYNQARPYEDWQIQPLDPKDTKGRSMPSRHVFSATMIAMCLLRQSMWWGIPALFLSAGLAIARVLVGVHYPKDVLAGYGVGVMAGLFLWWV